MDSFAEFALRELKSRSIQMAVCPSTLALNLHILAGGAKGATKTEIMDLVKGIGAEDSAKLVKELTDVQPKDSTLNKALIKSVNVIITRKAVFDLPTSHLPKVVPYSDCSVEAAKSDRGTCAKCKNAIPKDEAKYRVRSVNRCVTCFVKKELTLTGVPGQIVGWAGLQQTSQDALLRALKSGAAQAIKIEDTFKRKVRQLGDAIYVEIDTDGDSAQSATTANAALAAATNGDVVDALTSAEFLRRPDGTYLHILNVVRFEAHWKKPFAAGYTKQDYFHGRRRDRQEWYMNDPYSPALYSISSETTVVKMEYKDDTLRFVAIMTDDLLTWLRTLTMEKLQSLIQSADQSSAELNLRFPRFSIKSPWPVRGHLFGRLFDPDADYSEVSKSTSFRLSGITQAATFEATEEGSCVEPAGPVPLFAERTPVAPVDIIFNKPFLFLVMQGDVIIYAGQYV